MRGQIEKDGHIIEMILIMDTALIHCNFHLSYHDNKTSGGGRGDRKYSDTGV
jgi:hypothetical protein